MTKTLTEDAAAHWPAPPVFHVRRLREEYGESGLTPEELAGLAGIPRALLDSLERCPVIPAFLNGLLRLAFALQVPLADLIDDRQLRRFQEGIAQRRLAREGGERPPIGFTGSDT